MSMDIIKNITLVVPQLLVGPVQQAFMLLYLGPDSIMPLASILAAIIGIVLMFWRRLLKPFKKTRVSDDQSLDSAESAVGDSSPADLNNDTQK